MLKKTILFTLLFQLVIITSFSQRPKNCTFDQNTWKTFHDSKLSVVLDGCDEFNSLMKETVTNNWKFNSVEYITKEQFDQDKENPSKHFLLVTRIREYMGASWYYLYDTCADKKQKSSHYKYTNVLTIVKGHENFNSKNFNHDRYFSSLEVPLKSDFVLSLQVLSHGDLMYKEFGDTKNHLNNINVLPILIKSLNIYSEDIYSGKMPTMKEYRNQMKETCKLISSKPLYILNTELNDELPDLASVKKKYKGEQVFIISEQELINMVKEQKDVHLFVYNEGLYGKIYNVKTGKLMDLQMRLPYPGGYDHKKNHDGIDPFYMLLWK